MKEYGIIVWICVIALFISAVIALDCGALIRQTQHETSDNVLLIDPGHGGMDGGAVSSDGTSEKNINLAISGALKEIAEEYGWEVIMTREDDRWLCENEEGSIRSRKTEDLRARCDMLVKYDPRIAVSIHLNSFKEDPSVNGIQVFYPQTEDPEYKRFADVMQTELNASLDVKKARTALVRDGVLIFREKVCPIVIVECGFLSNEEEASKLKTNEYQKRLAEGIMSGIVAFTGCDKSQNVEIIDSLR